MQPIIKSAMNKRGFLSLVLHRVGQRWSGQQELKTLQGALIIPLGKAVEEGLKQLGVKEEHCLFGFPHPSGANGHRQKQFAERKKMLRKRIRRFFDQ